MRTSEFCRYSCHSGGDAGSLRRWEGSGMSGGGASDVRQGGDGLADRVLVVGGGGGAGGGFNRYAAAGSGGKGGGSTGGSGSNGGGSYSSNRSGGGGAGGTQDAGGSGGIGGDCDYYSGYPGANGMLLDGGAGGQGGRYYGTGPGGGGGGGGYYGGGGGGAGSAFESYCFVGGGGVSAAGDLTIRQAKLRFARATRERQRFALCGRSFRPRTARRSRHARNFTRPRLLQLFSEAATVRSDFVVRIDRNPLL